MKIIANNKKAFHDYEVLSSLEAGIVLSGDEVKSLRANGASLAGAFAHIKNGELFLVNCHISPYEKAYQKLDDEDAKRSRKLLVHKRELHKLIGEVSRKGITLVPLKIYFNKRNIAKVDIGLCKGKKAADKRSTLKERDIERETHRELRDRN